MRPRFQAALPITLLVLLVVAVGLIYRLAFPGFLLFDDFSNLQQLTSIADWPTTLHFILSGEAGPIGRPLALATFAAQSAAWPDDPGTLLCLNILIHQVAIGAAFLLAWGLARVRCPDHDRAPFWIALGVAALWGLSPFLATSHLMIVQRMTGLAGLFMLAGLAAFVWAHALAPTRPSIARLLLLAGLGLGTLLATLSKENGVLLPLLAGVILWLWIPRERQLRGRPERWILLLLMVVPGLALLGYLGFFELPTILEYGYAWRYFTPSERLMAQPTILLDYLQHLLLPRASAVTPFMDRYPAPQGWLRPPITLIALLFWPALLVGAIWWRRTAPVLLFGMVFFLVGHLLESSFIGLELYFAHRNYVPAFGLYFAVVYMAARVPAPYRRLAAAGVVTYVCLFAAILVQASLGWSQPRISAELWLTASPHSERAAQFLANQYLEEGDLSTAQRIIDQAAEHQPRLPYLQIQRTQICLPSEAGSTDRLALSVERLRQAYYEPVAATELLRSTQTDPSALCPGRGYSDLGALADALLDNSPYARSVVTRAALLATKGLVAVQEDQTDQAIALLTESFRIKPDVDIALFAASVMSNAGSQDELKTFLTKARQAAPSNHLKRNIWLKRLDDFAKIVEQPG